MMEAIRRMEWQLRLQWLVVLLSIILGLVSSLGWLASMRGIRVSLPPRLPYGTTLQTNAIHPWEVFSFAGYVWQQYGTWHSDGAEDGKKNLERLKPYFTPRALKILAEHHEIRSRNHRLRGRTRMVLPLGVYRRELVEDQRDGWLIVIEQRIEERLNDITVRAETVTFHIRLVHADVNPELNPWKLAIDSVQQFKVEPGDDV